MTVLHILLLPILRAEKLRPTQGEVESSAYEQPCRNRSSTPGYSVTAQDFSIGTLHATRQNSVPSTNFCGRIKLKVHSLKTCELANEGHSFFRNETVPLKRERAKIEGVQPSPGVAVEHWMLRVLPPSLKLSHLASLVLTTAVCSRIS